MNRRSEARIVAHEECVAAIVLSGILYEAPRMLIMQCNLIDWNPVAMPDSFPKAALLHGQLQTSSLTRLDSTGRSDHCPTTLSRGPVSFTGRAEELASLYQCRESASGCCCLIIRHSFAKRHTNIARQVPMGARYCL